MEVIVAVMAAMAMKAVISLAAHTLGLPAVATDTLATVYVVPLGFLVVAVKTLFPTRVGHRSLPLVCYVVTAQALTAMMAAVLVRASGECWNCGGNLNDIVFYAIAAGTAHGVLYSAFSEMFSRDVDKGIRAV